MFSKNNTKMNSRRECEKYNQYGIKKFNAGAASVLIASGFFFLGGAAQAADLASKQESNVENVAGNDKVSSDSVKKSEEASVAATNTTAQDNTSKQEVAKSEQAEVKVEKAVVNKAKLQEKINKLNDLFVTLAGRDLSETQQKLTVDAAIELNKAKDLIVAENATQAQVDAQTVAVENSISFLNKSLEVTKAEDKKTEEKKADKKSDKESAKESLEKAISEAKVVNQAANTFAAKSVKEEAQKAEIKAAVETAEKTIAKALDIFNSDSSTKQDSEKERKELERAIEAVYATMKRAGHKGELKGLLADVTSTVKLPEKTRVRNTSRLSDEEVEGIIRQVRIANPNLTAEDKISVLQDSGQANDAGTVTITYANGDTATIASGDAVIGAGVARNIEGLKDAINWFEFSAASIVYPDGTEVGPARYLDTPKRIQVDHPNGNGSKVTANLNIVRDVKYKDGTTGLTTDDKFLNSGITEFTVHEYYTGGFQNDNEAYEVLKEGMVLKVPTRVKGYNLTLRVEKLAPKQVATDPNNTATRGKNAMNAAKGEDKRFKPVKMILTTQDRTNSYLYKAGMAITDKNNRPALATITTNRDGANAGITFSASATFNGQPVPVNLVAADGEESGRAEILQFETNGSNWKELMAINLTEKQQTAQDGYTLGGDVTALTAGTLDFYAGYTRNNIGYNAKEWVNRVQDTDAQGNPRFDSKGQPIMKEVAYGTKLFGPIWNAMRQGNALGFGFSEDVTEFSMYMNSEGAQAGSIGFVVYDGGDAPQSYGSAQHVIGALNRVDSSGRQVVATQPYFGSEPGDPDFRSTATDPAGAWVLDDLVSTNGYKVIDMKEGNSVTNEAGETGTYKLVDVNGRKTPVLLKADGSTTALKTGEILKINNPEDNFPVKGIFDAASQGVGVGTLPDEGKGQLLDPAVAVEYKLRQATDDEYVLDGVKVNPGENNDKAYARGWVDFNNNGKFDEDESSEIVEVTGNQTVSFKFKKTPQLLNTSIDNVGVRLRIALDKKEILAPTGLASSGEVEDFQTHVIHPPRGTENKTQDLQGKPQNLTINTTDLFTATGKTEASKYATWNQIDNTVAPKFVVTDSVVASETPTGNTVNITDPSGTTVYNGTEVVIRDARGNELGTAVKITNSLNKTTEYLLSQYTEYDTAGNKVGVYTLNKDNNGLNKAGANGIYKTTIDFQPEKAYVGTAKGVAIRAWDENRISTGWNASEKTITESKKSATLADKDKILENVNKGINNRYSMDSTYIPTVIDVRPVGEDLTTTDVQGKEQTGAPKIPAYGTVETVTGEKIVDVKYTTDFVILNDQVKPKFGAINTYEKDTKVTSETTVTLEDGGTKTYKPVDKMPAGTEIGKIGDYTITGEGNVLVSGVRIAEAGLTSSPNKVPAGSVLEGAQPTAPQAIKVIRNGAEVTVNAGEKLKVGDKLVDPLPITGGAQITTWKVPMQKGDVIPRSFSTLKPTLAEATGVDKLTGTKGATLTVDGTNYVNNEDVIPKGTRVQIDTSTPEKLAAIQLPDAIHIDPSTGVVTSKPRKYTKFTDDEIVIQNEGTYRLNRDTGVVTFTPEPTFVGTGTGVELSQPDIDYNDKVAGDKVTEKYGTDYGHARYTPIVTPSTSASITRTIHYVYENDNDNPSSSDSYKDNKEILAIDGEPVVTKQTLNYTRTYKIFEEDGVLEEATRSAIPVTDATGRTYSVGTEIPAGTKFLKGQVIISEWKAGDQNSAMRQVISPTVKGYTANVVTADFTAANAQGKMGHIHNNKQPVGLYTPVTDNTRDVGEYEPLVSEVTSDKTDDFDMYVVYKRDTQKANVVYIDLDEKGDKRVLEIQSGLTEADLTAANKQKDAKTEYNVAELRGKSDTKIPYDTTATIAKYTNKGYELASDDYKNDENGRALADGRNFDEDSTNDQTFYVYLRHKKEQLSTNDKRTVTRHIEYKYADTTDVPEDKRGKFVFDNVEDKKTVTEVLTFERTRTLDMATTAKLFENEYNAYKAVLANNAVGSDAEVDARATLFEFVQGEVNKPTATDEVKAIISYGEWQAKPGTGENIELSAAEKTIKDSKFNDVVSPTVPGYLPDNAKVEATADVNPESDPDDYTVTVTYSPGDQKAIVNFVEVDATNTDQVITPGLSTPVTLTGKSGETFPTTANASVQAKIDELVKKGYELVPNGNGFVSTDSFDTNADVDQTYTVKLRAKTAPVVPTDNVTPVPGGAVDPNNPTGPKWPESVKNLVNKDTVKRTIKYVYEDGTPVIDPATGAQKVVEQTAEFTRPANVNLVTGDITYGPWTPAEGTDLVAVTSPTSTDIPAVAKYVPSTATVPVVKVQAGQDDITETVVYRKANPVTVQPNDPTPTKDQPIDPNNTDPNAPKWTEELLKKLEDARKEEVTRTITYKYSDVATDLKADDAAKAGTDVKENVTVTNTVTFKRPVTIDPQTGEFTYGDWVATNGTTLAGKADLPVVPGYVATGDVEKSKTDVTDVKATDKDITDKVVYKALGKFVPVVPEGFTPPTIENPQYPNNNDDPSKPGTPTTTIPYVPGTTPVGPDGQPLKPKVEGDPKQGYVPPAPTTPTGDTTITYVKDGTQIAVTKFVDTTGKGLEPSVVDTGDTGKAFTKDADVTAAINKILARGYEKVANVNATEKDYPSTDAEKVFDADASTNQEFTVTFKPIVKEVPVDPATPGTKPQPGQPVEPSNPDGPKWPNSVKDLKNTDTVKRTIKYVYEDGTPVIDPATGAQKVVEQTAEFTRPANVNLVTGDITYGPWTPANDPGVELPAVTSPTSTDIPAVAKYVPSTALVPAVKVVAEADDITETVVYRKANPVTVQPNDPTPTKDQPIDPNNTDPNAPKWTEELLKKLEDARKEEVTRTITYKYSDVATDLKADDAAKAGTDVKENVTVTNTVTFKRPVTIDPQTGEFTYGDWVATNGTTLAGKADLPVVSGYVATGDVEKSKADVTDVKATDKDITDKVVYKALGKFVPVVPGGFTPPTIENPQYPNNNDDPSKPGTPTTTIPHVPGLTPLNPVTGQPLEPVTPGNPKDGYKVPELPKDPTQNTTITYVKDGSQVAVVHFIDEKGNAVNESVIETGDTGGTISTTKADAVKAALATKGYEVIDPTDATVYTADKEGFYKEANRTFDAVSDKATGAAGEKVPSQQYYVIVKAKELPVVPTKPVNPNNEPVDPTDPTTPNKPRDPETTVTPKPTDPVPNDPKGRTYGELGLVEQVTRTIDYVYDNGTKVEEDKLGTAKDERTKTLTFTRNAKINAVTGEVTYLDANGNATTKELAPWTPATTDTFNTVNSPVIDTYVLLDSNQKTITGETVAATDKDIAHKVVYKKAGSIKPQIPAGVTPLTPATDTPYPNNPQDPSGVLKPDPTKPTDPTQPNGPTTPVIPEVTGYTPYGPNGKPLEKDPNGGYKVPDLPTDPTQDTPIVYVKNGEQLAITKFVDVNGNGLAPSIVDSGDEGTNFTKDGDVTATINAILARGYEKVANVNATEKAYPTEATDKVFDKDASTNQEFTVTFKPIVKEVPVDPATPGTKPQPGQPVDPSNQDGPKWPNSVKDLKNTDTVKRTIKYVYEDGTPVIDPATGAQKVVEQTAEFTRTANVNLVTGDITYGDWTPAKELAAVASPTATDIPAVANYIVSTATVPAVTVAAEADDITETVVYRQAKPVTITPDAKVPNPEDPSTPVDPNNPIQPNKPIDPNNPEGPKWTKELIDKLRAAREETVTRTITYKYSTETSELKAEDAAKAGQNAADEVTNTVTFKRPVTIDPVTKEFTYGDWVADNNDTTLEGKADLPVVAGYVATGDVEASKKDVENVKATDKDITQNVVYKTVGKYVPVIPAGITPPANTNVDPKPYNNDPQDGSKVKDPDPTNPVVPGTTTPIVPQIPGTTPVGPDGKPLKPVDSNDLSKGYVPPTPTDPTKDTSIIYVKDGSQVAVVHFVDEKGNSVNESVVETGDTGNRISPTKVDAVKQALEAKGYEVVAPTDALYTADKEGFYKEADRKFDAVSDKATGAADEKIPSQQYYVIVKAKDLPVDPTKPLDPNNNPVDPTNPTPENPTKPRDPNTSVTPKPEDKVPNDPKGRTYGELGLVEQVTRTINYVKNDGSKAADPVKETLTFTRKAKINAVTGEVTYLDNDGNATTKEAAPWTPVNNNTTFDKVTSPSVENYTPTRAEVPAKENVTATDEDIVETVVYNPTKQTVDPNAPKDPSTPNVTPKPNDVVPNDPKGRTYKELGLIEEVTRTVHYVYEDGTKAADDKVQTITFTRTAEIDTVTGAISNFGTWTLKDENNTFEPETTEAKAGYVASAAKSTEVTGVQATDKDTEETIIYRKLGSYVPVVPAGVTPPANFDKTPKPYPNATPEDPTRPGTPTTPTTTIPEIPGTTPVGPDGTPLTKNPNGGYDLPPVPTDPTQNTTITYVKDGSQVAVVHFVDEKGRAVNESVVETGDTGNTISKTNVDAVKAKLEAKGYVVVEPTDALYTTDKEGFYKEETRTFDAVSDKSTGTAGEKVPSQQYYVIVKAKEIPADPTKPGTTPGTDTPTNPTPENPTPGTNTPAKPGDKIPGDPLNRTYGDLGLVEEVTRTINYVKNDGTKAADPVKETLTFTRKAKINAVTGEVTYLAADGVTPVASKDDAPWTAANGTEFKAVKSPTGAEKPELANYTPTKAEVEAKTGVTATDEDIVETVVYNPTTETVDPKDPNFDPEKPLNPNNPNGPKYKDLKLTEEVARTITYTYADDVADTTKRGTVAAPEFKTTVSFTRTATINKATGEVTYSDWTAKDNDTTLEKDTKDLPLITGYVATGDLDKIKEDVTNVNATDKDITDKIVYKDLGKYVPVVPEGTTPPTIENPKYPNHPTDPTKPGEPTTTIPNVPGLTPLDPSTGKPLEPKDPNDLTKGYKPPVPQVPSENTNIVYVADGSQVTVVHFVDEDGKAVHTSFVEAGNAGAKFAKAGEVTKVVDELKKQGYVVVPNKAGQAEYPGEAGVFDSVDDKGKDGVSQVYYVTVAKTIPVTPTTPQNPNEEPKNPNPGDPIDPKNPNGPKWTKEALDKLNNIKSVTRTITYVKDGTTEEVSTTEAPKVTNKVSFTRTVVVNPKDGSVVGYDTTGDGIADVPATDTTSGWKAAGTAKFTEETSPVVKGYVVKPNQDTQGDLVEADGSKVKASTTDLTVDSPNQDLKVRYVAVGTWIPKVPEGETPIDPIPYPNDPKDPGKVIDPNDPTNPNNPNKPSVPVIPHIPGTTPKDPNGNPLKPVDPKDPSKGYVPPTPKTPTENTEIKYEKDTQKAVTKFVDPSGNPIPGVNNIEETGKSGEPLTKATEVTTEIAKLIAKGYDLVSNNYGKDNNGNFDKDSGKDQEYTVVLTPHVEPIKPFDPTNPNDPNTPKPGQPIDPKNPNGPKWTKELIDKLETTKHVNRTISYVKEDGTKVEYTDKDGNKSTADVTDKVTFTREAKINVVTGTIEYGKWTPVNGDNKFDAVPSPVAPGYVLKDASQKVVAETKGLTENSKDETIKVVYVPVGKVTITVPPGVTPPTPVTDTPYGNDPKDPGKVVPPSPTKPQDPQDPNSPKVPVIPHIPGTTPQVPKDPTKPVGPNNPLVPLTPVDPKDPSKGYNVPPVPTDPTANTPVNYVKDGQKAITNFVDNNGKVVSDPVVDEGESGSKFTKSGDVESKIKELVKKGYIVVSNDYPSADTDRVFDNDKDKDQIFNVKVTPLIVPTDPNSPDKPQVPTDPTKPVGPNNPLKPVTPSTPEPGKPVFPEDPNSPVWPDTVKDLVTESSATRTITYVDQNGKEVAAKHTETIKFKRSAKVNLVTGEITYGEWTVVGDDTILDGNKLPKVDGYIARGGDIKESQEDIKATVGANITQTVVYDKLGSWVPKVPEGVTPVPPITYPNDPTDPTKPGKDKPIVPHVPGFIPVGPDGTPLKPVDPKDPSKGYEVPNVPADPTKDTPISYVPVKPDRPTPTPVTPEQPEGPATPATPKAPAKAGRLANTGTTETNTGLAGLGMAIFGGLLAAAKRRKEKK